jgi:hypothetical protein
MTMARSQIVDVTVTRWYHCMSRCVRRAFLLSEGEGAFDRKAWIEDRIEELAQIFAVAVGGFSVMDNHLHLLLRLDPEVAGAWSDEEVVRRWGRLFPPRDRSRKPLPVSENWVQERLKHGPWVARVRERLASISWFMKCLKEPLSRPIGKGRDFRGAGRDLRSARKRCEELGGTARKTAHRPTVRPLLRSQPGQASRARLATEDPKRCQPGRVSGAITRAEPRIISSVL